MTSYTHQTAPTQYVEANGIRFAYRRFGKASVVAAAGIVFVRAQRLDEIVFALRG
jgi:hypothetical protein